MTSLTDRELQSLRNEGNTAEQAADEIVALRAEVERLRAAPAPVAQPRGYLLHWPAIGGGRQLVWSEQDSAGVAIGCPVEPVYSFGVREAVPQEGGAA